MVKNSDSLKYVFEKLLRSKKTRELLGENAKKIMESKKEHDIGLVFIFD